VGEASPAASAGRMRAGAEFSRLATRNPYRRACWARCADEQPGRESFNAHDLRREVGCSNLSAQTVVAQLYALHGRSRASPPC
jgi:hypothetical protein